jgi:hypothetical protein
MDFIEIHDLKIQNLRHGQGIFSWNGINGYFLQSKGTVREFNTEIELIKMVMKIE